jgi:hypothetical protein
VVAVASAQFDDQPEASSVWSKLHQFFWIHAWRYQLKLRINGWEDQ